MSDWLFDLGNSRFKAAPWHPGGGIGEVLAWPHGADALAAGDASHGPLPRGRRAWLASVAAPALTTQVLTLLRQRFEQVQVAQTRAECAGVRVAYAEPAKLGVDRYLALLGARAAGGGRYREFAEDTEDALASGCDGAAVALIERSLREAAARLGRTPALLLHGGGAPALQPWLPQARPHPALVLEGLALWAHANGDDRP